MAVLILGGIEFQDYEIPAEVIFGGKQTLAVHKLIGGDRVVDAMGPDDDEVTWSGRFQGADATDRAQALEALRASGAQVALVFGSFFYLVVVSQVKCHYQRGYQIPYEVSCTVVQSDSSGASSFAASLDSLVSGDMRSAVGLISNFAAGASLWSSINLL